MEPNEILRHARLDEKTLEAWVEAGWLIPLPRGGARDFSEIDLARARLIRDLREEIGVNDEGVSVILDLLDQLHGLRRTLTTVLSVTATRADSTDDLRAVSGNIKRRRRVDEEQAF
jgi:chaperone modulatory protein CbpM